MESSPVEIADQRRQVGAWIAAKMWDLNRPPRRPKKNNKKNKCKGDDNKNKKDDNKNKKEDENISDEGNKSGEENDSDEDEKSNDDLSLRVQRAAPSFFFSQ